jgi:protein FrlC
MKLSLYSGSFSRYPIEFAFSEAERIGYDGIEIWGGRPHAYAYDLKSGDVAKIKKLSKDHHLPIVGFTPENIAYPYSLVYRDPRMRKDSLDYYTLSLEMAKEMEAPFMLVAVPHPGYNTNMEENWRVFIENMRVLAETAEKLNINIALETLTQFEGSVLTRSDDLVRAIEEVNSPKVKGMVDFVAPSTLFEPILDYFEKLGQDLIHIHFVDSDLTSESHMIPGEGKLPLAQLVSMIRRYDYKGYCTIELEQASMYQRDPVSYAELAFQVAKELLG